MSGGDDDHGDVDENAADAAARSFLLAASRHDEDGMRRALAELAPMLSPSIERTAGRHATLVRRCRLEIEDVVQRVFERMLTSPPDNPESRSPIAVLIAWSRSVAINYLLDLARRIGREDEQESDDDDEQQEVRRPVSSRSAPQQRQHEAKEQWEHAQRCAETELARHKHLRELFYAIAKEPDLGAQDLASRIGLINDSSSEPDRRRAEQYVWKLRERVHNKLADYFEALEIEPAPGAAPPRKKS